MVRKLRNLLASILLLSNIQYGSLAQTAAPFHGTEGLTDPIQHTVVAVLPNIASSATAKAELAKLVTDYQSIVSAGSASTALRNWGVAKTSFYLRWGLSQLILGVPADQVSTYISRWRAHWANADRIDAAENLKVIAPTGGRIHTSSIRALPVSTQQLFQYDLNSPLADADLLANPNILGADPDQLKIVPPDRSGCDEFGHSPGVHGGGYAVDRRGLLLDRCVDSGTILHHYCPPPASSTASVSPSPSPSPSNALALDEGVLALGRTVKCSCVAYVDPSHKHRVARCG